jgi:hypothetical protein
MNFFNTQYYCQWLFTLSTGRAQKNRLFTIYRQNRNNLAAPFWPESVRKTGFGPVCDPEFDRSALEKAPSREVEQNSGEPGPSRGQRPIRRVDREGFREPLGIGRKKKARAVSDSCHRLMRAASDSGWPDQ